MEPSDMVLELGSRAWPKKSLILDLNLDITLELPQQSPIRMLPVEEQSTTHAPAGTTEVTSADTDDTVGGTSHFAEP